MVKTYFSSMRPNLFTGLLSGSSMYTKWYFEVMVIQYMASTHLEPVLKVGWANTGLIMSLKYKNTFLISKGDTIY